MFFCLMIFSKIGRKLYIIQPLNNATLQTSVSVPSSFFCCTLAGKATTMKKQEYTQQEYFLVHVKVLHVLPLFPDCGQLKAIIVQQVIALMVNFYCHLV